ncbi:MAG: hypothetical protein NZ473_04855 [Candidatus Kapabacteria bacterium]|nr:hypothetical protein [Candidatus Kapabacteria bacterium]MDW8224539.1 hypothetical protein [Bacteroidota bacterium]
MEIVCLASIRQKQAMPNIYDNIEQKLLDGLKRALEEARAAAFCVAYFHLRGWKELAEFIEHFPARDDPCCRILVGMHRPPEEVMRQLQGAQTGMLVWQRGGWNTRLNTLGADCTPTVG